MPDIADIGSVIQHGLQANAPSLFVPEPKTPAGNQACRSDRGWRFFPLYGCGKNTTAWLIAWTGYVWPATIIQAMGGRFV